ncbi:MAG: tRNA (adenosine(37)-N6)-threonylcarbamoyltransferase complex ATPase subunit type 1 TsaE [Anaerolineae bacterium]
MPVLDQDTLDFISHSPAQTRRIGARLGSLLRAGDLVCLEGELGTGKTRLAQGIGRGMGVVGPITSPTFTLVAEYRPPPPAPILFHIDLYRLDAPVDEAMALGLEEYFEDDGVCLIEWAERIRPILPAERLWVTLRHLDANKRGILMHASGSRYQELLAAFRHGAFGI